MGDIPTQLVLPAAITWHSLQVLCTQLKILCPLPALPLLVPPTSFSVLSIINVLIDVYIFCITEYTYLHFVLIYYMQQIEMCGRLLASTPPPPRRVPLFSDIFTLIYTSGSTGLPKGTLMSGIIVTPIPRYYNQNKCSFFKRLSNSY